MEIKCSEFNNNKLQVPYCDLSVLNIHELPYIYFIASLIRLFILKWGNGSLPGATSSSKRIHLTGLNSKMDITSLPQIDFSINAQKFWSAWKCMPLEIIGWNGDESIIFENPIFSPKILGVHCIVARKVRNMKQIIDENLW